MGTLVRSLALAIAALVLTLGAAELLLRASGRFPTVQLHSVSSRDHARIPGPWQPNQDLVRLAKPALPHRVRTNALGLRGPETSLAPRGPRVLCVGDSFTFGDFVEDDETLPAQLGARLGP